MSMIYVEAQDAGRIYYQEEREIVALRSATCVVKAGDRIALMGPSGSGKSTLLHLFAGLDQPTSGSVIWPDLGAPATLRPEKISLVFQAPSLLAPLSVLENVSLPLLMRGVGETGAATAALNILERMELDSVAAKLPEEISGGQAQRVAVARALINRPKLILADEPTGQLDHPTAEHLLEIWFDFLQDTETALVIATHDPAVAGRMRNIWQMEHGVLEARNE